MSVSENFPTYSFLLFLTITTFFPFYSRLITSFIKQISLYPALLLISHSVSQF